MSFLEYKAHEENLKKRYCNKVILNIEPIDSTDIYYTDGNAAASICKILFSEGKRVYVPQLIYNVSELDKEIISQWIEYVKGLNKTNLL